MKKQMIFLRRQIALAALTVLTAAQARAGADNDELGLLLEPGQNMTLIIEKLKAGEKVSQQEFKRAKDWVDSLISSSQGLKRLEKASKRSAMAHQGATEKNTPEIDNEATRIMSIVMAGLSIWKEVLDNSAIFLSFKESGNQYDRVRTASDKLISGIPLEAGELDQAKSLLNKHFLTKDYMENFKQNYLVLMRLEIWEIVADQYQKQGWQPRNIEELKAKMEQWVGLAADKESRNIEMLLRRHYDVLNELKNILDNPPIEL